MQQSLTSERFRLSPSFRKDLFLAESVAPLLTLTQV